MRDTWTQHLLALDITFQRAPGVDAAAAPGDIGVGAIMTALLAGAILLRPLLGIFIPTGTGGSWFDVDGDGDGDGGGGD